MNRADTSDPRAMEVGAPPSEGQRASAEERLAQALQLIADMKARDALKTQFLANISHDLRTPLTAIITHAEILRDGILGELTDRQRESISGIIGGGRQLLEMVSEILTYARASANQLTLTLSEFAIVEVIERVCALNDALASRNGLVIARDVDGDVRPIVADREKIAHVLGNLVGNAIEFTPSGGRIWISARSSELDGRPALLVEVGDSGIGIAPEHHELIFREFAQVDASASRRHHGTGLGLTIARRLLESMGATVVVADSGGGGAALRIRLNRGR